MAGVCPDATSHEEVRSLTVFFPAFNDANSLPDLIAGAFEVLRRRVPDHEVIVINDGSADRTAEVLDELRQQYGPRLRIVTHPVNLGYGAALRSGFEAATKEWIFYTDGDGQYDPTELDLLLDVTDGKTGLVNGYKVQRHDPWHRKVIGSVYNSFARALFRIQIRDIDCDFRLIRRDLVTDVDLRSTSGTICLELVRKLEMTGTGVIEVPVSHRPRLHGRSQFFRFRSLAVSLFQLLQMFCLLVLRPALSHSSKSAQPPTESLKAPSLATVATIAATLFGLALLAYGRALGLPLIADDYVQIDLAREYGPVSKWSALASDALYRCRATSLLMTYWTEHLFGVNPFALNGSSLLVHFLNACLVYALGIWPRIGWRLSAVMAALFVISSHPQEAVIWYAALPELLVFFFGLASLICWTIWTRSQSRVAYASSFLLFCTALASKESAVAMVPLMAGVLWLEVGPAFLRRIPKIAPFAIAAVLYFLLAYQSRTTHLHFNDGTFSLATPFWLVATKSIGRLLWVWGMFALAALLVWRAWQWTALVTIAFVWMIVTLLPYSFLAYMSRVPSRHTYFATLGLCMILAVALTEYWKRSSSSHRTWQVAALGALIILSDIGYIWTKKHHQFLLRAQPTEQLVSIVDATTSGPIYLKCFPYDESVAILTLRYRVPPESASRPIVMGAAALAAEPHAADLCNEATGRGRF